MKGADQCPRCASRKTKDVAVKGVVDQHFYGDLRVCGNCGTAWEPFSAADMRDPRDKLSSFREPCDNCAFRKGSNEQRDPEKFHELRVNLSKGGMFFCHKGVPINLHSENGFDYPADGKDGTKLRLCRGFLNTLKVVDGYLTHPAPNEVDV